MECFICSEKYDNNKRKPHTMYPCSHTICLDCLNNLTDKICPSCRSRIIDNKPNYALVDLLCESEAKNIKKTAPSKLNNLSQIISEVESVQQLLNLAYQNKLEQINEKFENIRNSIALRASQLISEADFIEEDLIRQLNQDKPEAIADLEKSKIGINTLNENQLNNLEKKFKTNLFNISQKITSINRLEVNNIEYKRGEITTNNELLKKNNESLSESKKFKDLFAKTAEKPSIKSSSKAHFCQIKGFDSYLGFNLQGSNSEKGVFKIVGVVHNSPAYKSGLLEGEYLIEVSGVNVQSMDYDQVINLINIGKEQGNLSLLLADKPTAKISK